MTYRVTHHDCVESTNDLALAATLAAWDRGETAEGIVHVAAEQRHGRGQHDRTWASPRGGLYLSAVLEDIAPKVRDRLALVAGVAVARAMAHVGATHIQIRWPNDLVYKDRKIAGILCESIARAERFAAIIGIGINVNTDIGMLTPPIRHGATTLMAIKDGRCTAIRDVESAVILCLDREVTRLRTEGLAPAIQRTRKLDALLGQLVTVIVDGHRLHGTAAGITDTGALLLATAAGPQKIPRGSLAQVAGQSPHVPPSE